MPRKDFVLRGAGVVIVAGVLAGGGSYVIGGGGPDPASAHAFVNTDVTGDTCTRSSTPVTFSEAQAANHLCGSFDAANDVCQGGDTVLVKAGTYAAQNVSGSNSRSSTCTIQAASGETVNLTAVWFQNTTAWVTMKDIRVTGGLTDHNAGDCFNGSIPTASLCVHGSNLTFDNVDTPGPDAHTDWKGSNNTWKNSEYGTQGNTTSVHCTPSDQQPNTVSEGSNILIDHNTFWQVAGDRVGCDIHLETFRIWDGIDGLTISNNYFAPNSGDNTARISSSAVHNCETAGDCNKNVRIINNFFGEHQSGLAATDVFFGDAHICEGWVIAYNFLSNGIGENCGTQLNNVAVGNMGTNAGGCIFSGTGAVNTNNLWSATSHGTCAGDAWVNGTCSSFICDYSTYNLAGDGYHLTATSPSINAGENSRCTTYTANLDIDGQSRSGVCDAGPDEYVP